MMIINYPSKTDLKTRIGEPLDYTETSMFGPEYRPNGKFCGSNRPQITGITNAKTGRRASEFFATVTMIDGLIAKVN